MCAVIGGCRDRNTTKGVLLALAFSGGYCFVAPSRMPIRSAAHAISQHINCLVTADDVELAVEKCEKLWADALAARKQVEELSNEAEELAEASALSSEEASATIDDSPKFKLSMIGDLKAVTDANLNANAVLSDAIEVMEEAELLERQAEAALVEMEEAIEQHLVDFPDSELKDEL